MENSSLLLPEGEADESKKIDGDIFSMRSNNTYSHIVGPLVNVCLTGELHALFDYCARSMRAHIDKRLHNFGSGRLYDLRMASIRVMRVDLIRGVTYTPVSLGMFEILTEKLRATNDGRPLSLYQEACCGLASGATAAFVLRPFLLASNRTVAQKHNYNYRNLFGNFHHIVRDEGVFALWKGSGIFISSLAAANLGMLASYNRSLNYLMESKGLSKWNAVLSASIISGFFAAACSHPCKYLKQIKDVVQRKYVAGEKHAYRNIPLHITRILTPHSGFKFYVGFLNHFRRWAGFCMVQWCIYEQIRLEKEE